jgi:DNA-binding NarL/FixJ family response regulator
VSTGDGVIRVVLADDQEMVRAGFTAILDARPDIEVVGEAPDGEQALDVVRRLRPDVVVMDIRMPGMDGLEATRRITADPQLAATKVLVLTTFDLDEYVFTALRAGASGFLLKSGKPADLPEGVRVVAAGDALLAPGVTRRLIEEYTSRPEALTPVTGLAGMDRLTSREHEVLALVAEGYTNPEIGLALDLSPMTVKNYIMTIRAKMGARDRVQLVVMAYRHRLSTC